MSIPLAAADRIIRNPHSLPRVPRALTDLVVSSRRLERHFHEAEQAHRRRKSFVEGERTRRIEQFLSAGSVNMTVDETALSTDSEEADNESGPGTDRWEYRRQSSFYRTRSFSMTAASQSKGMYFSPQDTDELTELQRQLQKHDNEQDGGLEERQDEEQDGQGQEQVQDQQHTGQMAPPLMPRRASMPPESLKLTLRDPEERLKVRCQMFKRPSSTRVGNGWQGHSWHRTLREEYRSNGQDGQWRQERVLLLDDMRRERQFQDQTRRRRRQSMGF